jgi:hypothetical protein
MIKKILLSIFLILIVLFLVVAGYSYGYKMGPQPSLLETSKVIQARYATAEGQVTEISGRNITLTKDGDSLSIPISEDAQINAFASAEDETLMGSQRREIGFQDLKIGDYAFIQLDLKANGETEGTFVVVKQQ